MPTKSTIPNNSEIDAALKEFETKNAEQKQQVLEALKASLGKLKEKGFTLIELLVVIAIISLLSSIVMTSLNSARNKAKDAAIKAEMSEVANLMALNYNDYGSYCQIMPQDLCLWVTAGGYTCDTLLSTGKFFGTYAQKARDLCNNIYNNAAKNGGYEMLICVNPSSCADTYSWAALLNNGNWYCSGSSGVKTESGNYWNSPGCYQNP